MKQTIIVFDFETTGKDPNDPACDIVEIAAVAIHSKNLEIIKNSEFFTYVRPDDIDQPGYYENHKQTIDWHLGLSQNKGMTPQTLLEKWSNGVPEKKAWSQFVNYINQYNYMNSYKTAPIAAGQNIRGFDLPIYDRINAKYKSKPAFAKRDCIDTLDLSFYWLAFNNDPPKSYKMDDLRPYFGMGSEHGHNALVDVKDEANIAIMYLQLLKKFSQQTIFRNKLFTNGKL